MVDELRLILLGIGLLIIGLIYAWGMRARIRERFQNRRREPGLGEPESPDPSADPEPDVWSQPEVRVVNKDDSARTESAAAQVRSTTEEGGHRARRPIDAAPPVAENAKPAESVDSRADSAPAVAAETASAKPASTPVSESRKSTGTTRRTVSKTTKSSAKPVAGKAPSWNVLLTLMAPERQPYHGNAVKAAAEQQQLVLAERGVWECRTGDGSEQMIFGIAHLREPGTFEPEQLDGLRTPGLLLFMPLPGPLEAVPAIDLMIEQAGRLQHRLGGVLCDERRNRLTPQSLIQLRSRADEFDRQMQAYTPST